MWEWERETFEWIAKSQSVNKMKSSSFFLLSACVCAMCHKKYMVWKVNALIEFACAPFNHTIKTPSVGKCHNIDAMTISLHLSTWILGTLFAIVVVNWIFYSNQSNICWNRSLVHRSYVCMQKKPPLFNGKFKVLVRVHNTNNNAQVFIRQENAVVDSDAKSRRDVTNTDDNKIMWIA